MVKEIVKSFAAGNCDFQGQLSISPYKVDRSELSIYLQKVIWPKEPMFRYTVIVGENGVGKTTAIMDSLCSIKGYKGAIYFLIEDPEDFSRKLSAVLNFRIKTFSVFDSTLLALSKKSEYAVDPVLDREPMATWNLLKPAIVEAAEIYKKQYNQTISLILDGIDEVAKYEAEGRGRSILRTLQTFAKNMADKSLMHVVFVTSDGLALPFLSKSSAISRASLFEVGDISDTQAVDYLEHRGVSRENATRAVKFLTGGRFEIILDFYRSFQAGESFEEILSSRHGQIGDTLSRLNMPCNHILFRAIYKEPLLNYMEFRQLNVSREVQEDLVKSNVLSQHVRKRYSFHDRSVKSFFEMAWSESGSFHRALHCGGR